VFVYSKDSFTNGATKEMKYDGQGWGLTTDGKVLFMSNGTEYIKIIHPDDFSTISEIRVTDGGQPGNTHLLLFEVVTITNSFITHIVNIRC
jgi:glutamine cyclotransferase